ncbi:MAG: HD domain-containing protein [Candidatus Paceibacterota bacterium]
MKQNFEIPEEVKKITEKLESENFEAFIVGGCVRDLLTGKTPKDWDITTNANPEQIQTIFPDSFYENNFGTVGVKNEESENESVRVVEVTPYRIEGDYQDNRHPETVLFSQKIEDDLKRRDFTMNAIAYSISKDEIVDLYNGREAIKDKMIVAVGNPDERFKEDALRILRAVRFASQHGFAISHETLTSMTENADLIKNISFERIRDEFFKIIMSSESITGIVLANKIGILKYIIPELEVGIGVEQNGSHIYDVWEHNLRTMQHACDKDWPLHIRIAGLMHDIGKPATREWSKEKNDYTFYGHEVVGAKIAKKVCERLRFSSELTEKVTKLVRYHMFFADPETITHSAVRRLVSKVGKENVWDLVDLRICDRVGMGRPKEEPYRLRKYESMIEEVMRDPVSVGMLKIDGNRFIEMGYKPGREMGWVLHALLEEVLDDPSKNTEEYLEEKTRELFLLPKEKLQELGEAGKDAKDEAEEEEIKKIRKEYKVN